jgi:glucose-1-phosphate adenylyltransferase
MQEQTISVVLAGGLGSRLHPLTADRAKPAVPFGGRYRIIDFTLSNCLHAGFRRVLVLTQYKSQSLLRHLRDGWSIYNAELGDYITPVPPQMRTGDSWYSGTADALYQNLYLLERSHAKYVLILSGDHIYRMDYAAMLQHHIVAEADATIACLTVPLAQARSFGVMTVNDEDEVVSFREKPQHAVGLPDNPTRALASMGVYVFSMDLLARLLRTNHEQESSHDLGADIIPSIVGRHRVIAYRFGGTRGRVTADQYWRDVGTIDTYYEANMDLLRPVPAMDLYQDDWAIRTYEGQYPPARSVPGRSGREAEIVNCMMAGGTVIIGATVRHSILFPNVRLEEGATVEHSLLFQGVSVGEGATIRRCIVDKNVAIPAGEQIGTDRARDVGRFSVSESGVVVVGKTVQFGKIP